MGRLKAQLAKSDIDRDVQTHVASAERQIRQALALCARGHRVGGIEAYRARRVRRDLLRVLGAMEAVRRLTPLRDEMAEIEPPEKLERPPKPEPPPKLPTMSAADVEVP